MIGLMEEDNMQKLNDLNLLDKAIVEKVEANKNIKKRFLDIGLIKGTKIKVVLISPLKDMKAYLIKGAVIAIRNEDTKDILVRVVK